MTISISFSVEPASSFLVVCVNMMNIFFPSSLLARFANRTGGKDRNREAAGLGRPRQSKPVTLELMDVPCVPAARKRLREEGWWLHGVPIRDEKQIFISLHAHQCDISVAVGRGGEGRSGPHRLTYTIRLHFLAFLGFPDFLVFRLWSMMTIY